MFQVSLAVDPSTAVKSPVRIGDKLTLIPPNLPPKRQFDSKNATGCSRGGQGSGPGSSYLKMTEKRGDDKTKILYICPA